MNRALVGDVGDAAEADMAGSIWETHPPVALWSALLANAANSPIHRKITHQSAPTMRGKREGLFRQSEVPVIAYTCRESLATSMRSGPNGVYAQDRRRTKQQRVDSSAIYHLLFS